MITLWLGCDQERHSKELKILSFKGASDLSLLSVHVCKWPSYMTDGSRQAETNSTICFFNTFKAVV